jgi:CRISPR/Cas system-associated exonuclease Cas4 (RecB family)
MSDVIKRMIHGQELIINEEHHAYTWGGEFVPGVTTILRCVDKPALMPWAIGVTRDYWLEAVNAGRTDFKQIHKESWSANKKISKTAADIGKQVHLYAECYFKNQPAPELTTDQAKRGVEAFHKWLEAHKVVVKASERLVFSKEHYYAGTCDFVAEIDGVLSVGDIKTSSGIYPEMRMQTAAYQHALEEEKDMKFDVRWIVRFDKKTGEFEAKPFYEFDLDFKGFLAALTLHRTLKAMAG